MKEIRTLEVSNELKLEGVLEDGILKEVVVVSNARKSVVSANDLNSVVNWIGSLSVRPTVVVSRPVATPGPNQLKSPDELAHRRVQKQDPDMALISDVEIEDRSAQLPNGGMTVRFSTKGGENAG